MIRGDATAGPQGGRKPSNGVELFPTPPWATRALMEKLVMRDPAMDRWHVWEPAAGMGHMARAIREYCPIVLETDLVDHAGQGFITEHDFLAGEVPEMCREIDWIITNPPFSLAEDFIERALHRARRGVAMLVRTAFLEGGARYERIFRDLPPSEVWQFAERVPMVKGRLLRNKPDGTRQSTATSYCWLVWGLEGGLIGAKRTYLKWIEPGARKRLEKWGDYDDDDDPMLVKMFEPAGRPMPLFPGER